jgi:hypothetical protein
MESAGVSERDAAGGFSGKSRRGKKKEAKGFKVRTAPATKFAMNPREPGNGPESNKRTTFRTAAGGVALEVVIASGTEPPVGIYGDVTRHGDSVACRGWSLVVGNGSGQGSGHFGFIDCALADLGFCALKEAGDVSAMADDDHESEEARDGKEGKKLAPGKVGVDVGVAPVAQKKDENCKRDGSGHGSKRNVAVDHQHEDKDESTQETGNGVYRPEPQDHAEGRGDALAAFELEVEWEVVAENTGDGGEKGCPGRQA